MQEKPILFGASGFIGKCFLKTVGIENCFPVSRNSSNKNWLNIDLLKPSEIEGALKKSSTVINLAYSQLASSDENIQMAKNLVQACKKSNITRLVHCSTAVVVGNSSAQFVNEETLCDPVTSYEKTKYQIEQIFLSAASEKLKVYILRPTAVIGPEGQNLKKMLHELRFKPMISFLRASIYGKRYLNLVPVKDVVHAICHLVKTEQLTPGIYICSADGDDNSQYHKVEAHIRSLLKKSPSRAIIMPSLLLRILLKLTRRGSGHLVNRYYSSQKLINSGFTPVESTKNTITDFVVKELSNESI